MRFFPAFLTVNAFLCLSGCATGPNVLTQRLSAIPAENHSYIVGTYVVTCEPRRERCDQAFNSISAYYRSSSDKDASGRLNSVTGSMFSNDTAYDFVDLTRKEKGFHFCIPLPAGDYVFYTFDFYNFAGGGSGYSIPEKNQFKLPLSLTSGEVAYVGRLKLTTTTGKNIFGLPLPAPGILLLSSDTTEIQKAALSKCPDIARSRPIRDASLTPAMANGNPLVQADNGR